MKTLSEGLKNIFLAGVGAVALTAEKSQKLVETLVQKGELTVEQGKVLNEELKRRADAGACPPPPPAPSEEKEARREDLLEALDALSPEELEALKARLADMENR